jgi:hypothetical protein
MAAQGGPDALQHADALSRGASSARTGAAFHALTQGPLAGVKRRDVTDEPRAAWSGPRASVMANNRTTCSHSRSCQFGHPSAPTMPHFVRGVRIWTAVRLNFVFSRDGAIIVKRQTHVDVVSFQSRAVCEVSKGDRQSFAAVSLGRAEQTVAPNRSGSAAGRNKAGGRSKSRAS